MESKVVADKVLADIQKRIKLGAEHYGTPLMTNNGRDALQDAYDEAIDLAFYLAQAIMERDQKLANLADRLMKHALGEE